MNRTVKTLAALLFSFCTILGVLITLVDTTALLDMIGLKPSDLAYNLISTEGSTYSLLINIAEAKIHLLILFIIISAISLYVFVKPERFIYNVKRSIIYLREYVIDTYKAIRYSKVRFLLILPLLCVLYWSYAAPVTYDESWTYLLFIKPHFWEAILFYPAPNNHVLNSVLGNVTDSIPFADLLFKIRIPAALFFMLSLVVGYRFVRKFYSENTAILLVAIYSMISIALRYGFCARGYSLLMFFFVVSFFAAYCIAKNGSKKRYWVAFALSGILGAYTMPSFLYPFATANLIILIYNWRAIKQQIFYNTIVGLVTYLLYSPILIFNGLDSLIGNEYVTPTDGRFQVLLDMPRYTLGMLVNLFNATPIVLVAIFFLPIANAIWKKDKDMLTLWVVFILTPVVMLTLHSILPFYRSFCYYGFALTFLWVVSLRGYIDMLKPKMLLIVAFIIQFSMFGRFCQIYEFLNIESQGFADLIEKTVEDNKSYCVEHDRSLSFLHPNLMFERERRGYNMDIHISYRDKVDADSIHEYDYLFVQVPQDSTKYRKPTYTLIGPYFIPVNVYTK